MTKFHITIEIESNLGTLSTGQEVSYALVSSRNLQHFEIIKIERVEEPKPKKEGNP